MSRHFRSGQSLVELLVGLAVGAVFVMGSAAVIAPSLLSSKQAGNISAEAQLGQQLEKNVQAWSAGNWDNVLDLATGTANSYYLNAAASPFAVVAANSTTTGSGIEYSGTSTEYVTLQSSTYYRYFSLFDVYRDANGNVTSTATNNYYDPSTKLVSVVVAVASSTASPLTYSFYIARSGNDVLSQSTWIGGSGQSGSATVVTSTYATSTEVSVSATGSLQLFGTTSESCIL